MALIDLIACLVSDELTRRANRLLDRRRKHAGFRDPDRTMDNQDYVCSSCTMFRNRVWCLPMLLGTIFGT
jgi:hypothetical protein